MPFVIVALTLFAALMAADVDAETDAERLAKKFSPILILTEDTVSDYGEDKERGVIVLKPEPVNIMGATSADSIWVVISDIGGYLPASGRFGKLIESGVLDTSEVRSHQQGWNSDFLGNKWAFLTKSDDGDILTMNILAKPSAELGSKSLLVAANSPLAASDDSLSAQTEAGKRIAKKAIAGSLSSVIFSYVLVNGLLGVEEGGGDFKGVGSLLYGLLYGHMLGFPIGVSLVDPYDRFFGTLMGSILGEVGGIGLLLLIGEEVSDELLAFAILGGPSVGSIIASEKWRKPPQDRRVSFGLVPIPKGGLSAVAKLRF